MKRIIEFFRTWWRDNFSTPIIAALVMVGVPQCACGACTSVVRSYVAPVVVKEVVTVVQPAYIAVPYYPVVAAYSVGYAAPIAVAPAMPMPAADPCADLRLTVQKMQQMIQQMQQNVQPGTLPAPALGQNVPADAGAASVLASRCASCHTTGRLTAKVPFPLLEPDGKTPVKMTGDLVRSILKSVKGSPGKPPTMPKNGKPLDDQEFSSVLSLVD